MILSIITVSNHYFEPIRHWCMCVWEFLCGIDLRGFILCQTVTSVKNTKHPAREMRESLSLHFPAPWFVKQVSNNACMLSLPWNVWYSNLAWEFAWSSIGNEENCRVKCGGRKRRSEVGFSTDCKPESRCATGLLKKVWKPSSQLARVL